MFTWQIIWKSSNFWEKNWIFLLARAFQTKRTISFRAEDETILEPGMTFHFMPGLWMENWGLEITESILITETGAETLCDYPSHLFVKP